MHAMAAQPSPGSRKRSGPALGGAGWAGAAPPAALENGFPPHKRPKSGGAAGPWPGCDPGDPFGDSDDFTADDLEEIEILASQALSQERAGGLPEQAWGGLGAGGGERRAAAGPARGRAPVAGREAKGRCAGGAGEGPVALVPPPKRVKPGSRTCSKFCAHCYQIGFFSKPPTSASKCVVSLVLTGGFQVYLEKAYWGLLIIKVQSV